MANEDDFGHKLPPTAGEIRDTVVNAIPGTTIKFDPDQALVNTVRGFGILDDSAARDEWGWAEDFPTIEEAVEDFSKEATNFPDRIQKNLELNLA